MPTSINLDPSAGTPNTIEIDGVCYTLAAGTPKPETEQPHVKFDQPRPLRRQPNRRLD
jgi:hypothetical protein